MVSIFWHVRLADLQNSMMAICFIYLNISFSFIITNISNHCVAALNNLTQLLSAQIVLISLHELTYKFYF